jgi:hypothetical protein
MLALGDDTSTHTRARARTHTHTHTHAHARARAHRQTQTAIHTHTHTQGLLGAMQAHEDDPLVFFVAFGALCRRCDQRGCTKLH